MRAYLQLSGDASTNVAENPAADDKQKRQLILADDSLTDQDSTADFITGCLTHNI